MEDTLESYLAPVFHLNNTISWTLICYAWNIKYNILGLLSNIVVN